MFFGFKGSLSFLEVQFFEKIQMENVITLASFFLVTLCIAPSEQLITATLFCILSAEKSTFFFFFLDAFSNRFFQWYSSTF